MKVRIDKYTFDASAKTVEFLDYSSIELNRVLLITNVTDGIIIYNFADSVGTVENNILTLDYDTTSMDDADKLLIFYQNDDIVVYSGGRLQTLVSDSNAEELLKEILIELKEIKLHLQFVTDEEITEGDLV
jgi:hypothetical protein